MNNDLINAVIKRIDFANGLVTLGFRSIASTALKY